MKRDKDGDARPVIVGVTGHRNLTRDDAGLMRIIEREIAKIARRYRDAPLLILSGLAEGADRLVVAAAGALGGKHVAVLPLPDALYTRDFATAASRSDYAKLRAKATRGIKAPLMASRRALGNYGEKRNHQYAWIGAYIAKRAQVLIALWDGAPARGTGGTAQVVGWYLADKTPRNYRISQAPRLKGRDGVTEELIHIYPAAHKVRRLLRPHSSPSRRKA